MFISSLRYKKDISFSQYLNIYETIKGRFSGIQVANDDIIIQGGHNTFYWSKAALLVLDGIIVDKRTFASIHMATVA